MRRTLASTLVAAVAFLQTATHADDVVLTLLHTNDMHCRVCLEGKPAGLSKLATLIDEVRAQMPHVLLLDAGDTISGQPEFYVTGGEGIVAAMNALKFDAMAVGNHEFDRGHERGAQTLAKADFAVLTANVVHEKTGAVWPAAKPYEVFAVAGVRVGVFGLTTPNTLVYEYPRSMGGHTVTDPIATARRVVPILREREKADVVVALSHWGFKGDQQLAAAVGGIDVILGGHTHTTLEEQVWINDTLVMQTGSHAVALGRADLWLRLDTDGRGFTIASINGKDGQWWGHGGAAAPAMASAVTFPNRVLHRPDASTPEHEGVLSAYRPYREKTQAYLDEVLATAVEPISGEGTKTRETPLGNLLADAIRSQMDADVAVMASGQFKPTTLGPGPVTMADLYGVSSAYTRQHLVSVDARGEHIRAMLMSNFEKPGELPLHVSGVEVTPDGVTLAGGVPLEDDKTYRVAGAAHVMQDHFLGTQKIEPKAGAKVVYDDPAGPTCRDALAAYLKQQGQVAPPEVGRVVQGFAEAAASAPGDATLRKAAP